MEGVFVAGDKVVLGSRASIVGGPATVTFQNLRGTYSGTPHELVAQDIANLRIYTNAPEESIEALSVMQTPARTNGRVRASVGLAWPTYPHRRKTDVNFVMWHTRLVAGCWELASAYTPHRYGFHDHGSEVANSATNVPRS